MIEGMKNDSIKMNKEQFIMGKFQVIDHPLIQHKLTIIRDKTVERKCFVK